MNSKITFLAILAVVIVALVIVFWPKSKCPSLSGKFAEIRAAAIELQRKQEYDEAKKIWNEMLTQLPAGECYDAERKAASQNIKQIDEILKSGLIDKWEKPADPNFKPDEGEIKRAAEFYVAGRNLFSTANLAVTGSGMFRDWGFRGTRYFAYNHQAPLETVVVENLAGRKLILQQTVGDVAEIMAISESELQLELPDSEILKTIAGGLDQWAFSVPQYRVIRSLGEVISSLDPNLKSTLTTFQKILRKAGIPLDDDSEITYVTRIKELAGMKVNVEYVVGLGVVKLEVLNGKKYPKEELIRFAQDTDALIELVLEKEAETAGDKPFELDAAKLRSLLSMNGKVAGKLNLQKVPTMGKQESKVDQFEVKGGRIELTEEKGANGMVTPKPGSFLKYDRERHLVTEADIEWNIESQWKSQDHLFFEAEDLRGIKVKSVYRAVDMTPVKQ